MMKGSDLFVPVGGVEYELERVYLVEGEIEPVEIAVIEAKEVGVIKLEEDTFIVGVT